jgi:hypothetical protein
MRVPFFPVNKRMRQIDMSNNKKEGEHKMSKQKLEFAADSGMTRVELETTHYWWHVRFFGGLCQFGI